MTSIAAIGILLVVGFVTVILFNEFIEWLGKK